MIEGPRVARYWRGRKERYCLEAKVCDVCNRVSFPPRRVCPFCAEIRREGNNRVTFVKDAGVESRNEVAVV